MCHFHYTTHCYTLPYQNAHKNKEKKPCKHDAARFSKTVLVPILSNQRGDLYYKFRKKYAIIPYKRVYIYKLPAVKGYCKGKITWAS